MATTRPFARNTGGPIVNSQQVGNIAIGTPGLDYSQNPGGVKWWMGPDEDGNYVIAKDVPAGNIPTPDGNVGTMTFWACNNGNNTDYVTLVNGITGENFASSNSAYSYVNSNGYWTNYTQGTASAPAEIDLPTDQVPTSLFYLSYTDEIVWTNGGGSSSIWKTDASNPVTSSSLATGTSFQGVKTVSPDGKKALLPITDYSGSVSTFYNRIGMYDGVTGIISTASMYIPDSSSAGYYHWTKNTSYDTLRNEFLVGGRGYSESDGSNYGPGYNKILRYATGSDGIEYVGYYPVSCSYQKTNGATYQAGINSVNYDPNNDLIYYTFTTANVGVDTQVGSVEKNYKIGTGENSDALLVTYPTGATNYNGWGDDSPFYHAPSNKLFVREAYKTGSEYKLDFGVWDITNDTYTRPSSSLYAYTTYDQTTWAFNSQALNYLIPQKDVYMYFNATDIWAVDLYNYSPQFQVSGSLSNGVFNDTMSVNTRFTYDSTNEYFWISFSAYKVFNTYDLSAI